ncbi:hypothetical protein F3K40_16320 [Streptomyces sp. LBUM 1478]|uniref:Putative transmembrane protein n=1 Tax=Streptomyces scabiei (strain 87.22) TaxID=680198 RepID=C9ZC01_STRSW|nr:MULTISPECIES: hypothetical protein [Streptomyces]MBP5868399.1 hypothetical protein [Streptomyces sp. LBUM 1485]MBP5906989.1 hypothetical protein [Streptomyces sp. LBUM 1478]MBP5930270.1 hypothetical protein [Streptomyces sp. LBUM 1479]MBP5892502.1 hypothetical protein [Streptomyces sp. LBUM 1481]MBP5915680.1 hypothetical protein [Streptomyces sp. LBUM 1486]
MHMNSVPQHLLSEDRQEFERILGEVLRSAPHRPEFAAGLQRLNTEQLRTMALNATAIITAAAATEYQYYVKVRDEFRSPSSATASDHERSASGTGEPDGTAVNLAAAVGEVTEAAGAGAGAIAAVLAPVLAGTAAVLFLLVGYVMKALDPERAIAETLLTTGWVFGAVTAAAILVAAVGLLLTALRNNATALLDDGVRSELNEEVARAREAWRDTLLERGILPFLRDALANPSQALPDEPERPAPPSRMPHLGYNRPSFSSSPDSGSSRSRPSFSSPDFTSPDFGGPEHQPE